MSLFDWTKSLFDVVRNYGLAAAVAVAGSVIGNESRPYDSNFYHHVGLSLVVIGYLLFLVNVFFSIHVIEDISFFQARRKNSLWSLVEVTIGFALGFLFAGAAIALQTVSKSL